MNILRAANLGKDSSIAHGFFGRQGGVSQGIYASFNCGPGSRDDAAAVKENRRRALAELGGTKLLTLHQIHSAQAVIARETWETRPEADALVTGTPGLMLGILTADCAPLLFADAQARVIGAAHAGWKGALTGVIEATLEKMESLGAQRKNIAAAIGPCIAQKDYEVGPEFFARFVEAEFSNTRFFQPSGKADHHLFHLEAYAGMRLRQAGIENMALAGASTYAQETDFFSFRRATHRGETDYGRQLSAILLKG